MKKNQILSFLKYQFFGLVLLFVFHFESINIGPVKISHLWKGLLLVFLVHSFLKRRSFINSIYNPLFALTSLQLLSLETVINPFNAILIFFTTLLLPLLGVFFQNFSIERLKRVLIFFAAFYVLCFVPYELGVLESIKSSYDLIAFGDDNDLNSLIGPFQTVHSASTALAASFIVIFYFLFTKEFNRIVLIFLLILCFYFLISTYVRTGMVMAIVGVMPILFYFFKKDAKTRFGVLILIGLLGILITNLVLSNKTLVAKITGQRQRSSETESFENVGSGRGELYLHALEIYLEANVVEKIIGMGETEQKKRMEKKLGIALVPHNGFLYLLLVNGVLGLLLFLFFLFKIYLLHRKLKFEYKALAQGLFLSYLAMTFLQNYDLLYMYLIMVLGLSLATNGTISRLNNIKIKKNV